MVRIVQKEHPILRENANEVPVSEITSPGIQKILKQMSQALDSQDDGVALAAPQIGAPLRIFIVSKRIFEQSPDVIDGEPITKDLVFINPVVIRKSREKEWVPEGCLSVRWLYGKTKRSTKATVRAHDQHGDEFTMSARGLLAQIFQHETDHLNGILFIDHAVEIEDLPPEKQQHG